ncbi:DUF433 domain-containing protein [Micromonospora sp. WMMD1102]|uniref:DUF433 domain-containing protein n=1 Tax=Micromonospora sp. WMMD1102 TaxID=3016105 RepID=UPI0024154198|nr:DUF433 domain-containing protein [Micromonospora sp. WMMD1102]MDG4790736.1 DUF433 domain-containing protein [Micromonospora sp. WMMD1102]MDG4792183.1 DUF433 domain-containing protein [Micromonospora sp. WMMD1102]
MDDVRFDVPLYTQAEAARYVDMPASTLRTWTQGYPRRTGQQRAVTGAHSEAEVIIRARPVVTYLSPPHPSDPSVPFIGLAEAMFLSALRKAGVPLQQIRPALTLVQERLGVAHALASRRLYAAGAQLLWEVSEEGELDSGARRALIVLRDGQYVFREVIERYLKRIEYANDGYAHRVRLPAYEVARVVADPEINFGHPFFVATGAPIQAVLARIRAGEPLAEVADDFDLPADQVAEVADRANLQAA